METYERAEILVFSKENQEEILVNARSGGGCYGCDCYGCNCYNFCYTGG
jgi:hypothetical protein